jgi:hypothetical protein
MLAGAPVAGNASPRIAVCGARDAGATLAERDSDVQAA